MRFQVYLSILVSILLLSVLSSRFRDFVTNSQSSIMGESIPMAQFQQAATPLADRLLPGTVVEWQVSGEYGESIYVDGKNAQSEKVFEVVFDKISGNLLCIVCIPQDGKSLNRSPRAIADSWLRRLANTGTNPYRWIRDGQEGPKGKKRYTSFWYIPNQDLSVTVNISTGQIITIRFHGDSAHPFQEAASPSLTRCVSDSETAEP